MIDPFGRSVTYMRLSVTDRCDLRCTYCMAEDMTFLPKSEVLSLEELERLTRVFIARGVRRVRLTGGEPLVRRGVMSLIEGLGGEIGRGLDELTLTTNGTQLARFARPLYEAGVRRVNVSCDSLRPDVFSRVTRFGDLARVLDGIDAAQEAGLAVKINIVALKGVNDSELPQMIAWAHGRGMDATLIETMPMGEIGEDRAAHFVSLSEIRAGFETRWTLTDLPDRTGGPARYVKVEETGGRLGFITPLSHNFCESCNRVRVTCTGRLFMCLGQDDQADLRAPLRASADDADVAAAIDVAIGRKPKGHDFELTRLSRPSVSRHMSVTGG